MALTAELYYISGLRSLARKTAYNCVPCRRMNATPCTHSCQQTEYVQLHNFRMWDLTYAGPLMVKRDNPRKPTYNLAYVAVFVCTVTKAIRLELVCDLSTEAFLASFRRFVNRRGLPDNVHSDNGRHFVGAQRELQIAIASHDAQWKIQSYCQPRQIKWHFIPVQSPHHGGLWEAGVREMK